MKPPLPSFRRLDFDVVIFAAQGYDKIIALIDALEVNHEERRKWGRMLAEDPRLRADARMMKGFRKYGERAISEWLRGGGGRIEMGHREVEGVDAQRVPEFVLKLWACWRVIGKRAPERKLAWLEALPEEVSSLITDIELNHHENRK